MTRASRWVGCLCLAMMFGCGEDLFNDMNKQGDEQGDGDGDSDGSGSQSGDGTGNIEGPRSGVDGDQSVSDLSDEDAAKFCTWAAEKVSELVPTPEQVCTIYALSSGDAASCASDRDACLAQTEGMPIEQEEVDPAECTASVGTALANGCDVTIAELEACFNDALAQAQSLFEQISCESGVSSLPTEEPQQPASCQLIAEKCPDLAMDSEGDGVQPGDDDPSDDYPGDDPDDGNTLPPDGEDPTPGDEPEATCIDGAPISIEQICDGTVDCSEGEDEAYCDQAPAPRPSLKLAKKLPLFR